MKDVVGKKSMARLQEEPATPVCCAVVEELFNSQKQGHFSKMLFFVSCSTLQRCLRVCKLNLERHRSVNKPGVQFLCRGLYRRVSPPLACTVEPTRYHVPAQAVAGVYRAQRHASTVCTEGKYVRDDDTP